jgi:RraA family protein
VATVSLNPPAEQVHPDVIAAFRVASTPSISDNLDRLPGIVGLRPFHRGGKLVGTAFTVQVRSGDNLAIHQALNAVRPGDVLMIAGGGDTSRALVGDIMKAIAESKGCAGFVVDGAIRDSGVFAASDFPCYARAAIHRGPYKQGPGSTNIPVSIGGWTVNPGDVVVGDEDGVVTFPPSIALTLIEAVRAQDTREAEVLQMIREGRYDGRYGKIPAG